MIVRDIPQHNVVGVVSQDWIQHTAWQPEVPLGCLGSGSETGFFAVADTGLAKGTFQAHMEERAIRGDGRNSNLAMTPEGMTAVVSS